MGEIIFNLNNLVSSAKIPTAVICCLIAGIVLCLVFVVAFFLELLLPVNDGEKLEDETAREDKQENYDFDALFTKLDDELKASKASKAEQAEKEAQEKAEREAIERAEREAQEKALKQVEESESKTVTTTVTTVETSVVGPEFDYYARLETINASMAKLEKDLAKASREVRKYEKTTKRKERNEKLLDRKAAELTNLNLVLYNVNDIKDIDVEKKEKQEALVEHIAELKNSIEDAKQYLADNKDKYENAKKIKTFLDGEKARYEAEIAELNALIGQSNKNKK